MKNSIKRLSSVKKKGFSSDTYWEKRYIKGGTSGAGSSAHLARFKADVLNEFVATHTVESVIEFGCGDGQQLQLAKYPSYTGYDVSQQAVRLCSEIFENDKSKNFFLKKEYDGRKADLSISLDVIFHLVEENVFDTYMHDLFKSSRKYIIIYSSNTCESYDEKVPHIRHRKFTRWVDENTSLWRLCKVIKNPFPYNGNHLETSFSDFYIFRLNKDLGTP